MERFKLYNLYDWDQMELASPTLFTTPKSGRAVAFLANTSGPVSLFWAEEVDMSGAAFLCNMDGQARVEFQTKIPVYLEFRATISGNSPVCYIKSDNPQQNLKKKNFEKFTNLEPRQSRNPEFDRMMMMSKYNEEQRQLQLEQEIQRLREEYGKNPETIENAHPRTRELVQQPRRRKPADANVSPNDSGTGDEQGADGDGTKDAIGQ